MGSSRRNVVDRIRMQCTFGPSMAHVPKIINRGFRDKMKVRTLRGSALERRREKNKKINTYSWKIL